MLSERAILDINKDVGERRNTERNREKEREEEKNEEDMKINGSKGYTEENRIKLLFCFNALSLIFGKHHFSLPKNLL